MGLMDFNLGDIGGVLTSAREAITGEKIKDPAEMRRIALELEKLQASLTQGQIDTNKIEAASPSLFVAGWRPAIGWICAVSLACMYIPRALIMTYVWGHECLRVVAIEGGTYMEITGALPAFPSLGTGDIIGLVGSLLGMGALRGLDKIKGVQTDRVG